MSEPANRTAASRPGQSSAAAKARRAGIAKALGFFRVMAIASGLALFVLVAIIVANGGFGRGGASAAWSPIHGLIYFVYVVSIANLGFKVRWSLPRMVLVMLSGFVPLVPFVVERRVTAEVTEILRTLDSLET